VARWQLVKQLTCPRCGDIVARAVYRRFPPSLRIELPDGSLVQPSSGAVLLRVAEQRMAGAPPADRAEAENDRDFVRRHLGELMYDLTCRRGHHTEQTMPAIVRAVRRTPGSWVPIR
jgi:hypothetical protein